MDAGGTSGPSPSVCPFVALADDRDRRADGPDPRNRCYAEPHPRQRDEAYQTAYCYSSSFSTCSVFLGWAARNAAEPAYAVPAYGVPASPLEQAEPWDAPPDASDRVASQADAALPGAARATGIRGSGETLDWVSASAWAGVNAVEVEDREEEVEPGPDEEAGIGEGDEPGSAGVPGRAGSGGSAESLTGPRVPAALPMRRRRRPQAPIRTRGSGEWYYSDPPERRPLVRRRFAVAPPVALGILGLLVVAIVVFLLPSLLAGGGPGQVGAAPSGSPDATARVATPRPQVTRAPDESEPVVTPEPTPSIRTYRVRAGDTLSGIAARFDVRMQLLQCRNLLRNPNLLSVGQVLTIPPSDYVCPSGWRRATPTPVAAGSVPPEEPAEAADE